MHFEKQKKDKEKEKSINKGYFDKKSIEGDNNSDEDLTDKKVLKT